VLHLNDVLALAVCPEVVSEKVVAALAGTLSGQHS